MCQDTAKITVTLGVSIDFLVNFGQTNGANVPASRTC